MTSTPHRRGEEGSALILSLVFLSVFGLFVATLLTFTDSSFRRTGAVRGQRAVTYAVDGAVDGAINAVRKQLTQGKDGGPCVLPALPAVNGVSTTVTCSGLPGSGVTGPLTPVTPVNRPAHAVLALGEHAGEGLVQGSNSELRIHGPVVSNSRIEAGANSTMVVEGPVSAKGSCDGSISSLAPPYPPGTAQPLVCGTGVVTADPNYASNITTVPAWRATPACAPNVVQFEPGYYDDAVALSRLTAKAVEGGTCTNRAFHFRPGTYYFRFTNSGSREWLITDSGAMVVGGTPKGWNPAAGQKPPALPGACATEDDPSPNNGVQFIFGGDSRMLVHDAKVELCAQPSTTSQQIALYGVKSGTPAQVTSTLPSSGESSVTRFVNPAGARTIGDGQTSDAALSSSAASGSITLTGYAHTIPEGSIINDVRMRVAHADIGDVGSLSVTVTPGGGGSPFTFSDAHNCGAERLCKNASLHTDSFNLNGRLTTRAGLTGLTVRFDATVAGGNNRSATVRLDGVSLDVTYTPPAFEAQSGCITVVPYGSSGSCALLRTVGSQTVLTVHGTTYSPRAAIDLELTNLSSQALGRGTVARTVFVKVTPSSSYTGNAIGLPPDSPGGSLLTDRRVLFVGTVGAERLRAVVAFEDVNGTNPGRRVRVESWTVLR